MYWMIAGIFLIGKMKPDRRLAGRKNRKVDSMASCWVEEIVEIRSPTPRLTSR
jgi:hypothetical protein